MKLSFSTIACPEWQWDDVLVAARDLGYRGVEIRGIGRELHAPALPFLAPEAVAATRQQLESLQLTVPCLATGCGLAKADQDEAANFMQVAEYIALAQSLGTPYVRVMLDDAPTPSADIDEALARRQLQKLLPLAANADVTLLVETSGAFADSARLAALVADINDAHLAVLWDVLHPWRNFGESPATTLANIGKLVRHVHVKDYADGGYHLVGTGEMPLKEMVKGLQAIGYDGYYSLEWVRRWDASLEEPALAFAQYTYAMKSLT